MKNLFIFIILVALPQFSRSQVCVTLFQEDNFGLEDLYSGYRFIEVDTLGQQWFGMEVNSVLYNFHSPVGRFNGATWDEIPYTDLPSVNLRDLAFDRHDSAWIATMGGVGIYHIETLEGRTMTTENSGLPESGVTAVAVGPDNTVWLGFSSGKVASYNAAGFTGYPKEWTGSPVNDIEVTDNNEVWVGLGSSPGLIIYREAAWEQDETLKNVTAIESDMWGRVMVASGDSMIIHTLELKNIVHSAGGTTIRDIGVRSNGAIWASSSGGLLVRSGEKFIPFSNVNSGLPASLTAPIAFDASDRLWFGYRYILNSSGFIGTGYLTRNTDLEKATITADKESMVFCYGDSLTLAAEGDLTGYRWPDGSDTQSYRLFDAATVEVAVEDQNKCFYYDTVKVNVQKVFEDEKVCAVSVDSNGRNIIIWEKTIAVGTESFNIYRELESDSFLFVDNIPFGKLSVFEDPDVDPRVRSASYKISAVDTCGNESGESFFHRTLHLQLSKGLTDGDINLSWSAYEGLDFSQYIINKGKHPDSLQVLTTLSKNFLSYTDTGVFDTMYYRISIPLPNECAPGGDKKAGTGPYKHSLSNMDDNKKLLTSGFFREAPAASLSTCPNPFSEISRVGFPNPGNSEYSLVIYDLSGKTMRLTGGIRGSEFFIRRGDLSPGYYLFKLKGDKKYFGRFVIR